MASSIKIIAFLKAELRRRGITYKQMAKQLGLSESAVKHMFSSGNCSLKRLDAIAKILNMEISDIVQFSTEGDKKINQLPKSSEVELANDLTLLVIGYACINHWSIEDIIERYNFSETELIPYLAKLDRMGIISLLANNRIKPLFSNNFSWHPNGPMDQFLKNVVQPRFFESDFSEEDAIRVVKHGDLTEKSRFLIKEKVKSLGDYFDELSYNDRTQKPFSVRQGSSIIVGARNWSFDPFLKLQRETP